MFCRMIGRSGNGDVEDVVLSSVKVDVQILDVMAQVEVVQCYVNSRSVAVEATYHFPLDDGAAITKCVLSIDGRVVKAALQEKERARVTYDAALASGQAAALVEEDANMPDVFTCKLGNLPAGAEAQVRLTYATTLAVDDSERLPRLRFTLPTAVAPRYFPASNDAPGDSTGSYGTAGSGPYGDGGYRLDVDVSARLASAVVGVISPSHKISAEECAAGADGAATVKLRGLRLDKDLVLLFACAEPHRPRAYLTPQLLPDGTRAVAVALLPDLDQNRFENDSAGEFVFVVDRSGSMGGDSMEAARQALVLCLASLSPGSLFNVVSFGSGFEKLFPAGSADYNDANKDSATAAARDMDADLGGTEILAPLQDLAAAAVDSKRPRQVVLITDGQVGNTREVIDFVKEQHERTGTRFFACGIGSGVSHALVNGVARAGGGAAEFIAESRGDGVQTKVMRLMARALQPTITGAVVDYGFLPVVRIAPAKPPPIYAGGLAMLYGLLRPSATGADIFNGAATVTVRMRGPDGDIMQVVPLVAVEEEAAGRLLHASAVRAMLRDLEEGGDSDDGARGADAGAGGGSGSGGEAVRRAAAVKLSIAAGVKCRWTSFVAVEERVNVGDGGAPLLVQVPIDMNVAAWPQDQQADLFCSGSAMAMPMRCAMASPTAALCMSAAAPGAMRSRGGSGVGGGGFAPQMESRKSKKMSFNKGSSGGGGGFGGSFLAAVGGLARRSATLSAAAPPPPPPPAAAPANQQQQQMQKECVVACSRSICDEEEEGGVMGLGDLGEAAAEGCFDSASAPTASSTPPPPPMPPMAVGAARLAPGGPPPAVTAFMSRSTEEKTTGSNGSSGGRSLADIMALQRADGSWAASAKVLEWLFVGLKDKMLSLQEFSSRRPAELDSDDSWATGLVLATLAAEMADKEEMWAASARKARRCLNKSLAAAATAGGKAQVLQADDAQLAAWLAVARA